LSAFLWGFLLSALPVDWSMVASLLLVRLWHGVCLLLLSVFLFLLRGGQGMAIESFRILEEYSDDENESANTRNDLYNPNGLDDEEMSWAYEDTDPWDAYKDTDD
jgi:hypothetical protein